MQRASAMFYARRLSDKPSAEDAVRLGCRFQIAAIGLIPPLHR
jgi:hypothetical protein